MVSLNENEGCCVYKMKGDQEKYEWDLNFKSIKDIVSNPSKEN